MPESKRKKIKNDEREDATDKHKLQSDNPPASDILLALKKHPFDVSQHLKNSRSVVTLLLHISDRNILRGTSTVQVLF